MNTSFRNNASGIWAGRRRPFTEACALPRRCCAARFREGGGYASPRALGGNKAYLGRILGDTYGFTLVELLIAMTLTAIIGMVLFSTYGMVMDNGKTVRSRVLERESRRVFWGILDNDIAGLCLADDKHSTLPPLSREPISLSDDYYRLTETDRPDPSDDEVLLSFATSSHLADMPDVPLPGPVCVEYALRNGSRSAAFIRRERAFCGVEGEFPWTELVLVRNVKSLDIALYTAKTQFVTDWASPVPSNEAPEAVRFTLLKDGEENPETFIAPIFPRRSHAQEH